MARTQVQCDLDHPDADTGKVDDNGSRLCGAGHGYAESVCAPAVHRITTRGGQDGTGPRDRATAGGGRPTQRALKRCAEIANRDDTSRQHLLEPSEGEVDVGVDKARTNPTALAAIRRKIGWDRKFRRRTSGRDPAGVIDDHQGARLRLCGATAPQVTLEHAASWADRCRCLSSLVHQPPPPHLTIAPSLRAMT